MGREPSNLHRNSQGFSLVELLVSLVFIAILMAGMANVFKSSLNTFYAAGESISSSRRNLMAGEMIYDDLNSAGMYLTDLFVSPTLSTGNPGFSITPNQTLTLGITDPNVPVAQNTVTYDILTLYMDQPLPFEGTNKTTLSGSTQLVASGAALTTTTFNIQFKDADQALQVKAGMKAIFKDNFYSFNVDTASPTGNTVTITSSDYPRDKHAIGAQVVLVLPAQQVRYSVQLKNWDPSSPGKTIPCLVRQQGTYTTAGFVPDASLESVIAENVSAFKVYLSMNPSDTTQTMDKIWAGYGKTGTSWDTDIIAPLNTQISGSLGRTGYQSITNANLNWFRDIPVAVRIDLTTRTTTARTEYQSAYLKTKPSDTGAVLDGRSFRDTTRTLVLVPRHFGLTQN